MPSGNGSGKSHEITAYSRHDCTTERTRQIPNARKCACPTNSVGPIAGSFEAARGAVDSSRRDASLGAHLQPVWNVFGDFLEIFPKGYGANVLIAACLLTSRMNVGPHGESQGKRSNVTEHTVPQPKALLGRCHFLLGARISTAVAHEPC